MSLKHSRFTTRRPPGGLPSKSPAIPRLPGTRHREANRPPTAVPTRLLPPPASPASRLRGLSLPARLRSAPSQDKEPLAALSHLWRGPPSLTLTPRPAQYHLLQEAAQLSELSRHIPPGQPCSRPETPQGAQQRLPPSSLVSPPGLSEWRSQTQRGHTPCAPSHQPKASSEPAPPGSSLCPQLPRAREGPRTGQGLPRTDWPQQRVPRACSQLGQDLETKATVKAATSSQHSSAPSEGPASPEVGPAGSALQQALCGTWSHKSWGPFQGLPHSPSGTQGPQEVSISDTHCRQQPIRATGKFPGHFRSGPLSPQGWGRDTAANTRVGLA